MSKDKRPSSIANPAAVAVTVLLKEMFPETEIVYVKAGIVSEFRHQYDMVKCREVNDLHHAKDAYLNIVLGNVYDTKFTKNPLNFIKENGGNNHNYSMKITSLLDHDIRRGNVTAWKKDETLAAVKKTDVEEQHQICKIFLLSER